MINENEKKELRVKLKELETHYTCFKKLIDAGLIIATTPFINYLAAVGFDEKNMGKQYKIYINAYREDWEI